MVSLLQRVTSVEDARRSVRIDQGLSWERTDARGNAVHVPLAESDVVRRAWGLRGHSRAPACDRAGGTQYQPAERREG